MEKMIFNDSAKTRKLLRNGLLIIGGLTGAVLIYKGGRVSAINDICKYLFPSHKNHVKHGLGLINDVRKCVGIDGCDCHQYIHSLGILCNDREELTRVLVDDFVDSIEERGVATDYKIVGAMYMLNKNK